METLKKSIGDILNLSNLSSNPGYYAGRSIDYGDITVEIILKVSQNIAKYLGKHEQEVFNQMVLDLPVLTGTLFVEYTIRLQTIGREDGWWWDKKRIFNHYNPELLQIPICQTTERLKQNFKSVIEKTKN